MNMYEYVPRGSEAPQGEHITGGGGPAMDQGHVKSIL